MAFARLVSSTPRREPYAVRNETRHRMQLRTARHLGIADRPIERAGKVVLAACESSKSAFTAGEIARRDVEKYLDKPRFVQSHTNFLRRPFIGKQKLDTLKTRRSSGREAIENANSVNIRLRLAARRGMIPLAPHRHRQR